MVTRTPVFRQHIDEPAAWTSETLGNAPRERLSYALKPAHINAIDAMLAQTAVRSARDVRREDVDHGEFHVLMSDIEALITSGPGAVVITGLDRERYDEAACERIFWAMGTCLGSATIQNAAGDRMSHVTQDPNHPTERGYRGSGELSPHTDAYAILGLMCLQQAESGGFSHLASALAIHNEILATRPDLLPAMYEGTYYASMDARGTPVGATGAKVPLFSCVDGQVSCFFSRQNSSEAVRQTGVELTPEFAEAAAYFEKLAQDPRFRVEFMLDPGEIMLVNNYVLVHARTEFTDSTRYKRDLLRLWLNNGEMRKVIPEMHLFAGIYDQVFRFRAEQAAGAAH